MAMQRFNSLQIIYTGVPLTALGVTYEPPVSATWDNPPESEIVAWEKLYISSDVDMHDITFLLGTVAGDNIEDLIIAEISE